ncbi:MAG: type II secretion system protein, partial [Planctomycetota bacterium]
MSRRRQSGFTFIEILVVMSIIAVLAGAVVVVVPLVKERASQTTDINNMRNLVQILADRAMRKGWPRYDGKNFHLSLVATGEIDPDNPDNLEVYFSPGDTIHSLGQATPSRFKEITLQSLKAGEDFSECTSYAGRRNTEREYVITPKRESRGVPVMCNADDGPLQHPAGLVVAYSNSAVKFKDWSELGLPAPEDPD